MFNTNNRSSLYSILRQKEAWYNRKSIRIQQVEAIRRLGVYGNVEDAQILVGFLNHDSSEIRSATIKSIVSLSPKLDSNDIFATPLKYCHISNTDIKNYVNNYKGKELTYLLAIASMNTNGYVREAALSQILRNGLSEELFPFVLIRLGDWVTNVRAKARDNFNQTLKKGDYKVISNNLGLIFWLKKVKRVDLSEAYSKAIELLLIERPKETLAKFSELSEKDRFNLCDEMLKLNPIRQEIVDALVSDKSYLVRSKLAKNIHRIENRSEIIAILQKDKSGIVRQRCLESRLKINSEVAQIDFESLLNDKSAAIRNLARFNLKDSGIDFLDYYKKGLSDALLSESSIYEIGEIGSKADVDCLLPFLESESNKLKRAAIRSIFKLDASRLTSYLINELSASVKSIRRLAIKHLSILPSDEVLERCREIYKTNDVELKVSMLAFFGRVGDYRVLPDLLLGIGDSDERIANVAWGCLIDWVRQSRYSKPSSFDKLRAKEEYEKISFNNELSYARKRIWKRLPYTGRFDE